MLAPSCATTGVGPPSGGEALLPSGLRGWCLMPGCSPDLSQAVPSSRAGTACLSMLEGSFPAPAAPPGLLLLPPSRACFLQQLRAKGCRAGSLRRRCVRGLELLLSLLDWGQSHTGVVSEKEQNQSEGRAQERALATAPPPRLPHTIESQLDVACIHAAALVKAYDVGEVPQGCVHSRRARSCGHSSA